MKTLACSKLTPVTLALAAAGLLTTAANAQIQTAGPLLVNIDAISLPLGPLTAITNHGTMGGYFEAWEGGTTVPVIAPVDGGGTPGIRFDGGDYLQHVSSLGGVLMPAHPGLVGVSPTCTIEAWVLNGAIDQEETIVSWGGRKTDPFNPDGGNLTFNYGWSSAWGAIGRWGAGDLGWTTGLDAGNTFGPAVPAAGVWHHLVFTFDGTIQHVYADGVLKNSEDLSSIPIDIWSSWNPITLAAQFNEFDWVPITALRGSLTLGRLRIHDGALTAAQVTSNYNLESGTFTNGPGSLLESGPIHRYPFAAAAGPATSGAAVLDVVGTAHGVVLGGGGAFTGSRLTLPGGASSSAAYVDLPDGLLSANSTNNGGTGEFTIEGWVRITGNQNWSRLFDFGSNLGTEGTDFLAYSAQIDNGVYARVCGVKNVDPVGGTGGGGDIFHGTTTFNQDSHFAITWNDHTGEITAYENGAVITRRTETARIGQINDPNIWLGRSNFSPNQNTQGEYDEIRLYNRVLSEAEMRGNFLRGPDTISVAPLGILLPPRSQIVEKGSNATFSITAFGTPPPAYQWRFNGMDIAGATATNYVIPDVLMSHVGNYSVVVTNESGSLTSAVAVLTVTIAELTWDGGGDPNPNFSTGANWLGDDAPPNAARLNFDGNVNLNPQNDLAVLNGLSNSVIRFNPGAGAFTLGGSPIRGGNVTNSSSVAQAIDLQLRLDAGRTIDTGSGGLNLGVPGTSTGAAQTWTKTGSGALTLRGNAAGTNVNYTINAGSMVFDTASGETTRLSSAAITLASGTQLRFNNAGDVALDSVVANAGSQIVLAHAGNLAASVPAVVQSGASMTGNGFYPSAIVRGQLAPGASIGSLTFSNLTLHASAHAMMELNRTNTPNADKFAVLGPLTLEFGGVALTVTNVGDPLVAGNTFDLYDASTFSGGSSAYFNAAKMTLPLLASGLEWNLAKLNSEGLIAVEAALANPPTNFARLKSLGLPERSGTNSFAHLIEGSDGALYGTTSAGTGSGGTVFKVNKDGSGYTGLHAFGMVANDGMGPRAGLIEGSEGALYGTTEYGGTIGLGVVFKLNKDGSGYAVLKSFTGADGHRPQAALLEGSDGVLYGTTIRNQFTSVNEGTVFKLNKDGSGFTVLHTFLVGSGEGSSPYGALIEATDGMLYGTTQYGGNSSRGTVFKLNKDGSGYGIIKHFAGVAGNWPYYPRAALVEGIDGVLYGTTSASGPAATPYGSLFKLNKDGSGFAVLKDFASADGRELSAPLIHGSDGALYGTSAFGGTSNRGTVFRILTNGLEFAVLKSFSGLDGRSPYSALLQASNGSLYGTTAYGGPKMAGSYAGDGTLFTLNTNGTGHAILLPFDKDFKESQQPDKLIVATDGMLYGTALGNPSSSFGNTNDVGAVLKLSTDGSNFRVLHSFTVTNSDGRTPSSLIESTNGALYGLTSSGGTSNRGTIFKLDSDGSNYTVLRSFTGRNGGGDGEFPRALLEGNDGVLYGVTALGGISNRGTIFRLNPDGNGYAVLQSFTGTSLEGGFPKAFIEGGDGMLYGTTAASFPSAGSAGNGTVFRINKDGSGYSVLRVFAASPDGNNPVGLIEGTDGVLYGTTASGGTRGAGTLFKVNKDGTGYVKQFSFVLDDFGGGNPQAGVVEGTDGALYGTASTANLVNGMAFRINKDGTGFRALKKFSPAEGSPPFASLAAGADGALYGTASAGGDLALGTIFKLFSTPASPMITTQPQSRTNALGSVATFTVTALGAQPLSYQWQFNEADVAGATGSDHTIASVQLSHAGNYRVIVTNSLGSVTSVVATLTVIDVNSRPIVANPIPDQTNTYGATFNFTFAANTFTDADVGQVLSYNAGDLPPGISFDAGTRTFSGTNTSVSTYSVIVTATDNGTPALSTNDLFDFVIEKAPLTATASDTNRVYGAPNPSFTGILMGVVNGDNITATFTTTATIVSPLGTYPITPELNDPDGKLNNYLTTTINGTLTITSLPELSFTLGSGEGGLFTLSWPANVGNFLLESTENLTTSVNWGTVASGITENGGMKSYTVTNDTAISGRLYRLRLP